MKQKSPFPILLRSLTVLGNLHCHRTPWFNLVFNENEKNCDVVWVRYHAHNKYHCTQLQFPSQFHNQMSCWWAPRLYPCHPHGRLSFWPPTSAWPGYHCHLGSESIVGRFLSLSAFQIRQLKKKTSKTKNTKNKKIVLSIYFVKTRFKLSKSWCLETIKIFPLRFKHTL